MSRTRFLSAIAVASLAYGGTALAQGPTSAEKRAELIQQIDALEKRPFDKTLATVREGVLSWLTEAPDVSVTVCGALLVDLERLGEDAGGMLLMQLMFTEARFILEHPERAANAHAVHLAGVQGVLRTYAAMKAAKPKLELAPIEALVRTDAEGKLSEFVTRAMDKCGGTGQTRA